LDGITGAKYFSCLIYVSAGTGVPSHAFTMGEVDDE
jgi:hypothetical protein